MKDMIMIEKTREKERLFQSIVDSTTLAEVAQTLYLVDVPERYMYAISNVDLDVSMKQGLTGIKNYRKFVGQGEMKLDWLHEKILALAIFVRHSRKRYGNEKITKNMKVRQDINPK